MSINITQYQSILSELHNKATLIAVSKTKPAEDIEALHQLGQRHFGENYVQELVDKEALLPKDIHWHFIGHLQSNKVKYIAPFVYLIHGVDSLSLLKEINKQAAKNNRTINCLLQIHIAQEETKFGLDETELMSMLKELPSLQNTKVIGLMGMASFTDDVKKIEEEFTQLHQLFVQCNEQLTNIYPLFTELSMGMSSDYKIAVTQGSTMVRIGSLLFGARQKQA